MSGYLLGIVGTVLLCAVLTAILPEGKTSGMIKGIAKLACLLAIIAPIPKWFQAYHSRDETTGAKNDGIFLEESVIQTDKSFIQYYSERRIELVEQALEQELNEKFHCEASVECLWEYYQEEVFSVYDNWEIQIKQIKIDCENWNKETKMSVVEYVSQHYCSEVLIE